MELNLQRQSITINDVVYDGYVEQPIECDALLPDYCPDIVKVLKCTVSTNVGSAAVGGDKLTIEGNAVAHIYYSSEQGAVRHAEYKIPFARLVELKSAPSFPVVTVKPSVDYVNCRAVNQRRVDVRGAITFAVKVTDSKEEQVITDAEGGGLQIRREMVQATDMAGQHDMTFPMVEDLELGYGKSPINTILRTEYRVHVQDYKVIAGKVVAKGDLLVHVCYQAQDAENKLETMEYTLPVSQIVDCEGADEECVCDVEMYVVACDIQPKQDGEGEYRIFAMDAKVKAVVTAYRHKEIPVASDCYSTQFESTCKHRPVTFLKLVDVVREVVMHKTSLELPEGVDSVLDAWCEVDGADWKQEADSLALTLKLTVSMFAQMEDGEVLYFEQQSEEAHSIALPAGCADIAFEPTADILSSAYNLVGKEKIDIRCEVMVKGCILRTIKAGSLSDIAVDENAPKPKAGNKLFIYYAEAGESVWSIAKSYNTSAGAIWEENAVEADVLTEKCMLLIPIV